MDPIVNMLRQRELAKHVADASERGAPCAEEAAELADLVLALDKWRRHGGFDPYGPPLPA